MCSKGASAHNTGECSGIIRCRGLIDLPTSAVRRRKGKGEEKELAELGLTELNGDTFIGHGPTLPALRIEHNIPRPASRCGAWTLQDQCIHRVWGCSSAAMRFQPPQGRVSLAQRWHSAARCRSSLGNSRA